MGIASRRLDLGVPQQLADHRQVLAERKGPAGEAVPKIVDAHHIYLQEDVWRCMEMYGDEKNI